jgi:hypothetical protein
MMQLINNFRRAIFTFTSIQFVMSLPGSFSKIGAPDKHNLLAQTLKERRFTNRRLVWSAVWKPPFLMSRGIGTR